MTIEAPPRAARTGSVRVPVLVAAGAVLAATAILVRDPHQPESWGVCPIHALTGGYCPGCGSLRACHDLLTGNIGAAFGSNLLVPLALVWFAWWWLRRLANGLGRSFPREPAGARFGLVLVGVIAVFTVLRNLPGSPLAP